jgi:hypothetical protein
MPHQRREAIARRDGGDETLTDIARNYNVSHSFFGREEFPAPGWEHALHARHHSDEAANAT